MKTFTQISKETGISQGAISNILAGRRKPSWRMAKKLESATGVDAVTWIDKNHIEIRIDLLQHGLDYDPCGTEKEKSIAIRHRREKEFVENYFDHDEWVYEPVTFYLNGTKYTPDFYDRKRDVFIEVAGTRQAYANNKGKYKMFRKLYPKVNFEIRTPDGELWGKKKAERKAMESAEVRLSKATGIAVSTICNIKMGRRRPSWAYAKLLADCTRTKPALWLDGTPEQIRAAMKGEK